MDRNKSTIGTRQFLTDTLVQISKQLVMISAVTLGIIVPAMPQNPELQQKLAAVKQAAAENKQKLLQYQWTETTQLTLKGEARAIERLSKEVDWKEFLGVRKGLSSMKDRYASFSSSGNITNRYTGRVWRIALRSATLAGLAVSSLFAQQPASEPCSAAGTTSLNSEKQLPAPPKPFGGVIKRDSRESTPCWNPRVNFPPAKAISKKWIGS